MNSTMPKPLMIELMLPSLLLTDINE
jgi:hypothetical protein